MIWGEANEPLLSEINKDGGLDKEMEKGLNRNLP